MHLLVLIVGKQPSENAESIATDKDSDNMISWPSGFNTPSTLLLLSMACQKEFMIKFNLPISIIL
jgi:hypothetical protein